MARQSEDLIMAIRLTHGDVTITADTDAEALAVLELVLRRADASARPSTFGLTVSPSAPAAGAPGVPASEPVGMADDTVCGVAIAARQPVSTPVLAEALGWTLRRVRRSLDSLVAAGHIVQESRGRWTRWSVARPSHGLGLREAITETDEARPDTRADDDSAPRSDRQALLAALRATAPATVAAVQAHTGWTVSKVRTQLMEAEDEGAVRREGRSRATRYFCAAPGAGQEAVRRPHPTAAAPA